MLFPACKIWYFTFSHVRYANASRPIYAYWTEPAITTAKCINDDIVMQASVILNTLSEVLLATLPLLGVFHLKVKKQHRWQVLCVLSLGYVVGLVGCIRIFYIWKGMQTFDFTWWSGPLWICSEVENNLAIVCFFPLRNFFS